jgi:lipoprotein-anchoring transpeptidase ErfK/SrfK
MKRIEVSIGTQKISLWDERRLLKTWSCSTSGFGIGFQEGSNKTPVGSFVVREKHGDGAEQGTIFKSRQPVGIWTPDSESAEDLVLTRILWLHGLEPRNANTYQRYIYIHGTNQEARLGVPCSHGCVRMRNSDVIELFDQASIGMAVWIEV